MNLPSIQHADAVALFGAAAEAAERRKDNDTERPSNTRTT